MLDIAWAAGIWEGEGHCQSETRHKEIEGGGVPVSRVNVTQKDPEILRRLSMLFGGRVYSMSLSRGRTERMHAWYVTGRVAIGFLFTIFTLLSQRRRAQAQRVIAAWKTRPAHLDLPDPAGAS